MSHVQYEQHAQLLEDREKELQQLSSRKKEQLEQLAKQGVELIAREQKLAADATEQKGVCSLSQPCCHLPNSPLPNLSSGCCIVIVDCMTSGYALHCMPNTA